MAEFDSKKAGRPATGSIQAPTGKRRSWQIRYRVGGRRITEAVGRPEDGVTRSKAEEILADRLAEIRVGAWEPRKPEPANVVTPLRSDESFREFAESWLAAKLPELRPKTITDYKWALELHLLPFFADMSLESITVETVDAYKAWKVGEGKLAPNGINKTISRLAQILEVAVEYGRIDRNPAKGRGRRVKATEPKRSWVEPEQLMALLDACDRNLRPLIAAMAGAGLRVGEACSLDWGDVNFLTRVLIVRSSKTAAGEGREVDLPNGLLAELEALYARRIATGTHDPVFTSRPRNGKRSRQTPRNVQARLRTAVRKANKALAEQDIAPIGDISPHSMRRLYASMRAALHDDPVTIAEQLGHRDFRFTFRVYQRAAKRREKLSGRYLEAFDAALVWAQMGVETKSGTPDPSRPS